MSDLNRIYFIARSQQHKLSVLFSLLYGSLHNLGYNLIFVCETWLSNEISDGLLLYKCASNLAHCDRSGHQQDGGVCS